MTPRLSAIGDVGSQRPRAKLVPRRERAECWGPRCGRVWGQGDAGSKSRSGPAVFSTHEVVPQVISHNGSRFRRNGGGSVCGARHTGIPSACSASISRSQSSSARCSPPGGSSRLGSSASKTAWR